MRIDIITIFPGMFAALNESIVRRAEDAGLAQIHITDLRNHSTNKHRNVDDYSYGGGPGMVMQSEPFFRAVDALRQEDSRKGRVILLGPRGKPFNQRKAQELASQERIILLCGHYEGIDERVRDFLADEEISLGDFVLTGGEIPAMAVADAVIRLLPGVLPRESVEQESFTDELLEFPQYTRPAEFRGMSVPDILLSGDHEKIRRWRREQSLLQTLCSRPDLLKKAELTKEEQDMLRLEAQRLGLSPEL